MERGKTQTKVLPITQNRASQGQNCALLFTIFSSMPRQWPEYRKPTIFAWKEGRMKVGKSTNISKQ